MFFLINKPEGISSFLALKKVKKAVNIKKAGHTGTLDPFATGCLLIATGNSTKLIPLLEGAKKEYIATVNLSGFTPSYDTETPVQKIDISNIQHRSKGEIESFLMDQTEQVPPIYSALNIDGKRAYEFARNGEDIVMEARKIVVYDAEVLNLEKTNLTIRLIVSSGCYIRSFGPLLGNFFGVTGGYLESLQRTKIITEFATFSLENSSNMDEIREISYSMVFPTIPTHQISGEEMIDVKNGKALPLPDTLKNYNEGQFFFLSHGGFEFLSLCQKEGDVFRIIKNEVQ